MFKSIIYTFTIICVFFLVSTANLSNIYISLKNSSSNNLKAFEEILTVMGGKVNHTFPPSEFICFLPEDKVDDLKDLVDCEIETMYGAKIINNGYGHKAWSYLKDSYLGNIKKPVIKDSTKLKFNCGYESFSASPECKDEFTGPDAKDRVTNNFMIGKIAVAIVLMESNGSAENWTDNEENIAIGEAIEAYDWLADQAEIRNVQLDWIYEIHTDVPTGYEPIQTKYPNMTLPCTFEFGWIDDALGYLNAGDDGWHGLFAYANHLRSYYKSNWAFTLFIIKNDNTLYFPNGASGYTMIYETCLWPHNEWVRPPFAISSYNYGSNGPSYSDYVIIHESSHVFGAMDEYEGASQCENGDDCGQVGGYLRYQNRNCFFCEGNYSCLMKYSVNYDICPYTLGHIGWVDSDGDDAPDPIDPNSGLWSIVPSGPVPGDLVRIFTIDGDFVNLISCTEQNTFNGVADVLWDCHNRDNQTCAPGLYYATVNNGAPTTIYTHSDGDEVNPMIKSMAYQDNTVSWYLDSSFAYTTCTIFDSLYNPVARPLWNQLQGVGNRSISTEGAECTFCTAEVYGWRPDGGLSNTASIMYENICFGESPWSIRIDRESGYSMGLDILNNADGEVIVLSFGSNTPIYESRLRKFDSTGCLTWKRIYRRGGGDLFLQGIDNTSDGGYIVAGYPNIYLMKLDQYGDVEWIKDIGGGSAYDVKQTDDEGYIVTGIDDETNCCDAFIMKTNSSGNVEWKTLVGQPSRRSYGNSIIQASDGGFVAAGVLHEAEMSVCSWGYVAKTDEYGNFLWSKAIGDTSEWSFNHFAQEVIETAEGDYVVCGRLWEDGWYPFCNSYLMKLGNTGDSLWLKQFAGRESALGYAVKETAEGGYIMSGMTNGPGKYRNDVFIVKTDTGGNMLCQTIFGNENFGGTAWSIDQMDDSSYICAGEYNSSSFILKFDQWPTYRCGDANSDLNIDLFDTSYLISYLYQGGPPPEPMESGDANGDGTVNLFDVSYLISYLYKGGPEPVCPPLP